MPRKILIFILTLTWVFLFPTASLASSCQCVQTSPSRGSVTTCDSFSPMTQNKFTTPDTCYALNTFVVGSMSYSNCHFYPDTDDCKDFVSQATTTPTIPSVTSASTKPNIKTPYLEIGIPGLKFSMGDSSIDAQGNVQIPFLGQYITAVYKFLVIAASLVAVVVIILGGFQITVSAGGEGKAAGIKRVTRALTGLFILWSSYVLLYTINPNLTAFKPLGVQYFKPVPLEEIQQSIVNSGAAAGTVAKCTGYTDEALNNSRINSDIIAAAKRHNIDPLVLYAITYKEDGWTRGPCGEVGATQLMPSTVEGLGQTCCTASTLSNPRNCPTTLPKDTIGGSGSDPYSFTCRCGHCEQASQACVDFFMGPDGDKNSFDYAAKLIGEDISKYANGDIGLIFAGYNGGRNPNQQAQNYAKEVGGTYNSMCQSLGGKQ